MQEKIDEHKTALKNLEESFEKNPSDDLQLKTNREKDSILHFSNTQTGNPKKRAQKKSELASEAALGKAVKKVAK